jgi:alkaline phosphatase
MQVQTFSVDKHTTDSSSSANAFLSGAKAYDGVLGVESDVRRGDCNASKQRPRDTIADWARARGKATGLVTTTRITHATPAALYAHSADRDWESDYTLAIKGKGYMYTGQCDDIARQFVFDETSKNMKVALAGGRAYFQPIEAKDYENETLPAGHRRDRVDLIDEWKKMRADRKFVWNREQLMNVDTRMKGQLLGRNVCTLNRVSTRIQVCSKKTISNMRRACNVITAPTIQR